MNIRMRITGIEAALLLALYAAPAARAEDSAAVPVRGMTMTSVEQSLGKPAEVLAAVGNPPITRWVYPTCTVYFEYQYVIHSVLPHPAS